MAIVIVYDSIFGNTQKIAEAIAVGLAGKGEVRLVRVNDAARLDLTDVDCLIVGSPTRGFNATPSTSDFVEGLDAILAAARKAAAFDTRLDPEDIKPAPLRWVVHAGGYAADRIAAGLKRKGFTFLGEPEGFRVGGTEGPMKPGELERATAWAAALPI
ncbi:flavodoxin family protein [Devosia sp.]|uniref:flavodoxin family protein n=1 Tax=Devosia sp. TaxID=1871048 RepID=UPI003BAC46FC